MEAVIKRDLVKRIQTKAYTKEVAVLKQQLNQEIYNEVTQEARGEIKAKIKEEWRLKLS